MFGPDTRLQTGAKMCMQRPPTGNKNFFQRNRTDTTQLEKNMVSSLQIDRCALFLHYTSTDDSELPPLVPKFAHRQLIIYPAADPSQ